MQHHKYNYLFEIQFLGIRYSGWQFIEGQSTVEGMLRKTLKFIWGHDNFKTFGAGRTDAKVSAEQFFVHVFSDEQISSDFVGLMNFNLPADIAMLSYSVKPKGYNALAEVKSKEYHYKVGKSQIKNVFEAANNSSISRVIVISSASIFDGMKHDSPHLDMTPELKFRPKHNYGASKYDAELVCLGQPKEKWIGLRPRAVFGKGDKTLIPRLKRLIGKNHYKTIGNGEHLIDVTCLSNFIDAVCLAIKVPSESLGKFYNISNGDPRTFNSIMQTYVSKYSSSYKQRKIPYYPVFLLAHFNNLIANLVPGKKWEPRITPYGLRQVTTSLILDISGAKEALGWTPKLTFEQGMEELE